MTREDRERIAAELNKQHGQALEVMSNDLYLKEPTVIGIALAYLDCRCLLLRGFDEGGEIVGNPKIIAAEDSCTLDHTGGLAGIAETSMFNSILWKDSHEEFDRKYGNEKRIDIANKLFPPPTEE